MNKKVLTILVTIILTFTMYAESTEPFIKGADVSMLKQLEDNGAKFYDENNKEIECMTILKSYGVNWIRIRTWVNPKDSNGKFLGGGNNDTATTLILVERAKKLGMKVLLDFHYSDFWADPAKQDKPASWDGISGVALEGKLYKYTADILSSLKKINALPDMVQVGNELNGGMVWPNGKTWKQGDETIGGYEGFAGLLKAGIKAVKDCDPNIKIMIHLANGGDNEMYRRVFDELTAKKVEYDTIGLSFYPYWHGSFESLQKNLNDISERYGKDVIVAEISYAYTLEDGDGMPNIFGANEELAGGFKATVKGQENVIKKVMNVLSNVPYNKGKGFFYWEPDWIPKDGCGWKTGEGNGWENQAMFDFKGKALSSLNVFRTSPDAVMQVGIIEAINTIAVTTSIGEAPPMPDKVYTILTDGSIVQNNVEWDKISEKNLKNIGTFTVAGKVAGTSIKASAIVTVTPIKNYIADFGFELGDIWKNSKWVLNDTKSSLQMEKGISNIHKGSVSLSYWKDSNFTFNISQTITGLENGTYKLKVWSMGAPGGKKMSLYANNGTEEKKVSIIDTGWSNWNAFEIPNISVTNGTVTIGISANCVAGDWGKLDDFELIKTK